MCCASALAAASAYGPPDPIATIPSSGSIRSPLPESRIRRLAVQDDEHRFEAPQDAIGAPVLGELDGRAFEIAAILLELGLEPGEERERVGGRAGEPGQDAVVVEPPDLAARCCLTTVWPKVTWPSPAITVWPLWRTARTVVAVKHGQNGQKISLSEGTVVHPRQDRFGGRGRKYPEFRGSQAWQICCRIRSVQPGSLRQGRRAQERK